MFERVVTNVGIFDVKISGLKLTLQHTTKYNTSIIVHETEIYIKDNINIQ